MRHLLNFLSVLGLLSGLAQAQTPAPRLLPFQARLTDATGQPLPDGARVVQFQIFGEPTGGTPLWAGEVHRVTLNGGLVNVMLGSRNPLPTDRPDDPTRSFFDAALYLQVTPDANADDKITEADPPLLPRQAIVPVLFAAEAGRSRNSDRLAGHDWSTLLGVNDPVNGRLPGTKLADGSVTAAQMADRAVTTDKIADGAVHDRHVGILSHLSASDGDPANAVVVDSAGSVVIGTPTDRANLQVHGDITTSRGGVLAGGKFTPLDPITLGQLPMNLQPTTWIVPEIVPATASEILIYVAVSVGYTPNAYIHFQIYTEEAPGVRYAHYFYVTGTTASAISFSSQTFWLPLLPGRQIGCRPHFYNVAITGVAASYVALIGYR